MDYSKWLPETIKPADSNGFKEDGYKKRKAGSIVLQQVEDVKPTLRVESVGRHDYWSDAGDGR